MQEDLKARVARELEKILPHDGSKDFINANTPNEELKDLRQELKLTSKSKAPAVREALRPYLGDDFEFRKSGKGTTYLTRKMPTAEIVFNYISHNPDKTPKVLAQRLPMLKKDFLGAVNELLAAGRIISFINGDYVVKLKASAESKPKSVSMPPSGDNVKNEPDNARNNNVNNEGPVVVTNGDLEAFRAAFVKLDKGRLFVPITELRKELSQWSREKFDEVLRTLRKNRKIQLHQADRSKMTDEEWADVFVDENGFAMRRVTWNEKF